MQTSTPDEIRAAVRQAYGAVATRQASSCCSGPGCCGAAASTSRQLGYSDDRASVARESVPSGACCDSLLLDTCCEPADKPGCCGTSPQTAKCGCQNPPR